MATIVKYSDTKRPVNAYPWWIVSPQQNKPCCTARMVQVGRLQPDERGRPFSYRRCEVCGFTLRHFLPVESPKKPVDIQRRKRLPEWRRRVRRSPVYLYGKGKKLVSLIRSAR